ncbi:MAG: pilus assembly protein [Myxococcaceae bacterium]|nr:pilus assembly protein [Myxococcaceae bacterium]
MRSPRGAVAVEFALSAPLILLLLLAGLHFTRALVTRLRLADAVTYAARSGVVAGSTWSEAQVRQAAQTRMGVEAGQCEGGFQLQVAQVPGAFAPNAAFGPLNGRALQVTATCALPGRFQLAAMTLHATAVYPF